MTFTHEIEVPAEDGEGTETVTLEFLKPFSDIPAGLFRRNRHDQDARIWACLEWALSQEDLKKMDSLKLSEIVPLYNAWGNAPVDTWADDEDKPKAARKTGKASGD